MTPKTLNGGFLLFFLLIAGASAVSAAAPAAVEFLESRSAEPIAAPTSGAALLAAGVSRLPTEPVELGGWISMRRPRGLVSKELEFKVELHWGGNPPLARYTVAERKGEVLEQIIVRRGEKTAIARLTGPMLEPAEAPAWNDKIQGTDVTWLDVSLEFLWWRNPRLVGEETVKGRLCDILEVQPETEVPDVAKMRLWLDRETSLLLKAVEINSAGKANRELWVRSVRKMGEHWMVKDLEVQSRGSGHRTRVHIDSLRTRGESSE